MPPTAAWRWWLLNAVVMVTLGAAATVAATGDLAEEATAGEVGLGEQLDAAPPVPPAPRRRVLGAAALLRVRDEETGRRREEAASLSRAAQVPPVDRPGLGSHWWSSFKAGAIRSLGVLQGLREYGWAGYFVAFLSTLVLQVIMPPPFDLSVCWLSLTVCFVYGFSWGFTNIWLAKTAGSVLGFFIFQRIGQARGWDVPQVLKAKLQPMHDRPWATVVPAYLFVPLSPWVKNYGFALCRVDILPFAVGVLITFCLPCLVEAFVGSSSASLAEATDMDILKKVQQVVSKVPVQAACAAGLALLALLCAYVLVRHRRNRCGKGR